MQGRFGELMGALRALGLGVVLWAGVQGAWAGVTGSGPYSEGGNRSGYAGDDVSLTIHEPDLRGFNSALLVFSFDSSVLSFNGVDRDCNDPSLPDNCSISDYLSDVGGTATYSLLVTTNPLDFTGPADIFSLLFTINGTASPGTTRVTFDNFYTPDELLDPLNAGTYDRQSLTGTITILDRNTNPVPTPGTAPLALAALALLALTTRRRPASAAGHTRG